jgi:hypothetical protein
MAARSAQTHAKRARELAVKERRERKRAKKAAAAALRAAKEDAPGSTSDSAQPQAIASEADDEHRAG